MLVEDTLGAADQVTDSGVDMVFERSFKDAVGELNGELQYIVKVVVRKATGRIVTAHPTGAFRLIAGGAATLLVAATNTASARADVVRGLPDREESTWGAKILGLVADILVGADDATPFKNHILMTIVTEETGFAIEAVEQQQCMSLDAAIRDEIKADVEAAVYGGAADDD